MMDSSVPLTSYQARLAYGRVDRDTGFGAILVHWSFQCQQVGDSSSVDTGALEREAWFQWNQALYAKERRSV